MQTIMKHSIVYAQPIITWEQVDNKDVMHMNPMLFVDDWGGCILDS